MKGIRESCKYWVVCRKRNAIVYKYKTRPIPVCWDHFWMLRQLQRHLLGDLSHNEDVIRAIMQPEKALDLLGIDMSSKVAEVDLSQIPALRDGDTIELVGEFTEESDLGNITHMIMPDGEVIEL